MADKAPAAKKPQTQSRADREADRRRVILRAAVEVFSRKGYHGCRIQDVAKEAGVAYGLVYHYFKNKDELLESVFASGWQNFLGRVQAEIATDHHVAARVKGIVHVAFEAYRRDPRGVKVLILEVGRSPAGGAVNRGGAFSSVILAAAEMFKEAQRRGEIPAHLEPTLCATMLFGSIEMGLTSFVMGLLDKRDDASIDRARDQVAETFLHGLTGARPPPAMVSVPPPAPRARSRTTS
ncbi:MAG: TetR/AcrR family transcriptional regulator [Archangium sp.]|nr:TetR/AcrR family transcriptional regulator [Archangium sp.]